MTTITAEKPIIKNPIVTRKSLSFRLTMNIIGISGCFLNAMITTIPWLQSWFWTLTLASICGFILSCIDYAKAK